MTESIILAGNPNVGKSTLFNRLTGLKQHTGNWTGKTVGSAVGLMEIEKQTIRLIDTPGTYSLLATSPDEEAARDAICFDPCDAIIVVCDACCIERGLYLTLQIMERRSNIILCVNLMDEAKKKGIIIDFSILREKLGIPVVGISAARGTGMDELLGIIHECNFRNSLMLKSTKGIIELKAIAREICTKVVSTNKSQTKIGFIDRALSHKILAWPIMLGLLFSILWISINGANYPSKLLSDLFAYIEKLLRLILYYFNIPPLIVSAIVDGIYGTTAWVVSVMLPPMAIFFPLFTLLEDWGLLPRIAFNMDCVFKKCGSCGKQALCMCMGLGCNAVGVTGCRIIGNKREKLISILTNSFMPCNGRFPTLILLASILFPGGGKAAAAALVMSLILFSCLVTFASSWLLSLGHSKNKEPPFCLELPPFRRPRIGETLLRSLFDRTFIVLLRAIKTAAPAGLIIWLLANININGSSILTLMQKALNPAGIFFALDGAILLGFILGLPANEIIMPVILMCYMSGTTLASLPSQEEIRLIFTEMGWTNTTLLCLIIFTLLHWPCATTLLTIKKECGKLRYVFAAAALPTVWGLLLCLAIRLIWP